MPLRSLIYLVEIIKPYIKKDDLFGKKLIKIPTPKFVVVYNGKEDRPPFEELRISDAFCHETDEPQLELKVIVYNINPGKYEDAGYNESIKAAIEWCLSNEVLVNFLTERKPEVIKAMDIDMTFERREALIRRDEREEGRNKGRIEARQDDILNFLADIGSVSTNLESQIKSIDDEEQLKTLLKSAARADSIEEFEILIHS